MTITTHLIANLTGGFLIALFAAASLHAATIGLPRPATARREPSGNR